MRMLGTLLRVLLGFIIACLVAGVATVAFVVTPGDIAALPADALPERLGNAGVLSLLAATHSAIFAFPLALIAIAIAEWFSIRSWIYYVIVGILIAIAGFCAVSYFEVEGQPTIVNDYALRAFLTVGVFGGLAYWLVAGRRSGGRRGDRPTAAERAPGPEASAEEEPTTSKTTSNKLAEAT
jgi:hypothetical protein